MGANEVMKSNVCLIMIDKMNIGLNRENFSSMDEN